MTLYDTRRVVGDDGYIIDNPNIKRSRKSPKPPRFLAEIPGYSEDGDFLGYESDSLVTTGRIEIELFKHNASGWDRSWTRTLVHRWKEQGLTEYSDVLAPVVAEARKRDRVQYLLTGRHRLAAARQLGWKTYPAYFVHPDTFINTRVPEELITKRHRTFEETLDLFYERTSVGDHPLVLSPKFHEPAY